MAELAPVMVAVIHMVEEVMVEDRVVETMATVVEVLVVEGAARAEKDTEESMEDAAMVGGAVERVTDVQVAVKGVVEEEEPAVAMELEMAAMRSTPQSLQASSSQGRLTAA